MNYDLASVIHEQQWRRGRQKNTGAEYVFPYNYLYKDDEFLNVMILINTCETQEIDPVLVDTYVNLQRNNINLGPIWVTFGKKLQNGTVNPFWHEKCYVVDGNHRVNAAIKLGETYVNAIIPESDYMEYKRKYNNE